MLVGGDSDSGSCTLTAMLGKKCSRISLRLSVDESLRAEFPAEVVQ